MRKGTLHLNMTGEAAELYFMARAAALGLIVSKAVQQNSPYDVIIEAGGQLRRVQVKSTRYRGRCGWYQFNTIRHGHTYRRGYQAGEIDFLAGYVAPLDIWYILPISEVQDRTRISFRPDSESCYFHQFRERWDLFQLPVASSRWPVKKAKTERTQRMQGEAAETAPEDVIEPNQPMASETNCKRDTRPGAAGLHPSRGTPIVATLSPEPAGTSGSTRESALSQLNAELMACARCPRLVAHREQIGREKRRAYRDCEYWAKPVPGFGDPGARLLILGLAPGAHGSNRTGRMFTGDSSGNFLYPVLHRTGFANQSTAKHRDDGLRLQDAYITAVARCAPPGNKPTPQEIANCSAFLDRELQLLAEVRVVVALGRIAFDAYLNYLKRRGVLKEKSKYVFAHDAHYRMPDGRILLASYHPSNQNTQTGKLNEKMLTQIFRKAARLVEKVSR
jgi:uracil-DNA glycosylase family 4